MDSNQLVEEMTLEEKAALLSGTEFWKTNPIPRLAIPSIFLSDGPHGLRKQSEGADHLGLYDSEPATSFPTAVTVASSWNTDNLRKMGEAIAEECLYYGASVLLGPGINIKRNPLCGRNFEYYSEDPFLTGELAIHFINGVQSKGIGTSVKHFAANNSENYRFMGDSIVDERALREIYLRAFERVVKEAKPATIMSAYNKINGTYCSESKYLLNDILREQWGFEGVVVSDWGGVADRVAAVEAGLDLEMPGDTWEFRKSVIKSLENGSLAEESVNKALRNILHLVKKSSELSFGTPFNKVQHAELACEIAKDSAVLLKNEDVLPLNKQESVLVVGDLFEKMRYQGAGSSLINPSSLISPKKAFDEMQVNYSFENGYRENEESSDQELMARATEAAGSADTILFFGGLTDYAESEGTDRATMKLPTNQLELLSKLSATGKQVIVILFGGSPVELPFYDDVHAILNMYLPGQHGGEAAAALIFGNATPSGKLAETWPMEYQDVPFGEDYSKNEHELYQESIFVGYRYYDKAEKEVRFPFGFGKSYTTFAYSNLVVENIGGEIKVTCDITNTGNFDGAEVVQLYVKNNQSDIFKAEKELRAFDKVYLKVGETKKATMSFSRTDLSYYNIDKKEWVLENGLYSIEVGESSKTIHLREDLLINGEKQVGSPYIIEDLRTYYSVDHNFDVTTLQFEGLLGYNIPPLPPKTPIGMETRLSNYNETFWGRRLYSSVLGVANRQLKQALKLPDGVEKEVKKKNAIFLMNILQSNSARTLAAASAGRVPFHIAKGFVALANGQVMVALKMMLKKEKVIPLPKASRNARKSD